MVNIAALQGELIMSGEKPHRGLRAAAAKLAGDKAVFGLPPGAEGDTTGEYSLVQKGREKFPDEETFHDQPPGEAGAEPTGFAIDD